LAIAVAESADDEVRIVNGPSTGSEAVWALRCPSPQTKWVTPTVSKDRNSLVAVTYNTNNQKHPIKESQLEKKRDP